VHGKFTIDALKEIEHQFNEEPPNDWEYNVASITYECTWEGPQCGEYGRYEIPGYWDFTEIFRTIFE